MGIPTAAIPPRNQQTAGITPRTLHVVLYPFIPNFASFKAWVVSEFEKRHPDVHVEVIDLANNYYGSFVDGRICTAMYEASAVLSTGQLIAECSLFAQIYFLLCFISGRVDSAMLLTYR